MYIQIFYNQRNMFILINVQAYQKVGMIVVFLSFDKNIKIKKNCYNAYFDWSFQNF